jgi:hypothetical protein
LLEGWEKEERAFVTVRIKCGEEEEEEVFKRP